MRSQQLEKVLSDRGERSGLVIDDKIRSLDGVYRQLDRFELAALDIVLHRSGVRLHYSDFIVSASRQLILTTR